MNIKRLFALLLVLTVLAGNTLAETEAQEEVIPTEALIGLWVCDDNDQVELQIVPGSYAPLPGDAEFPELFIEGVWKDPGDRSVHYIIQLNREKKQKGNILDFLGLNPAVSTVLKALINSDTTTPNFFYYEKALIGINGNDNNYDYTYTNDSKGVIYAYRDDDGSLALEWLDDYDPHIPGLILHRVTAEVPSAQELIKPSAASGDRPGKRRPGRLCADAVRRGQEARHR